ncbi:MAG: hypothetical protein ACFE0S_03660 [Rhodospirillales bacterium]
MINEYYSAMTKALRERNFPRAAGYLRMIYQNQHFHFDVYRQFSFQGASARDVMYLMTTYVREFDDDPSGYMMLAHGYYFRRQFEMVRKTWCDACQKVVKGYHFQPSIGPTIFDVEHGQPFSKLRGTGLGAKVMGALKELKQEPAAARAPASIEDSGTVSAETTHGEPIGMYGVALNGRLAGYTQPTRYYFRYGFAPDRLTETTPIRDMPAGVHGHARDTAENLFRRISFNTCMLVAGEIKAPAPPQRFPMVSMKSEWPFGKDRNHRDGIGVIDLFLGWNNLVQRRGRIEGVDTPATFPTPEYPGEAVDLRDSRVTIRCRTSELDMKAFRPVIWLHGRTGTAVQPDYCDDLSAWAVTALSCAQTFTVDGAWHAITFNMPGLSTDWTFCGSNVEEMGDGMLRYTYAPIQNLQRANVGGNLCLTFVGGDELDTPEGELELAELELAYRSRSLLGPGQEAELVHGPGDAGCLTDGTLGDVEHLWQAPVDEDAPLEFVWRLRGPANLSCFKVHQNVLAPAAGIEIAISGDEEMFTDVWIGTMADVPEDPLLWGGDAGSDVVIHVVVPDTPVCARFVRLRIMSGQRPGAAGLDAFEVFGDGLPFIPSADEFSFSEAVTGLKETGPIYTQLVAENDDGIFEGDVVKIARPAAETPFILSVAVTGRGNGTANVSIRAIAMGEEGTLAMTLMSDDGEDVTVPPVRIGKWHVPADTAIRIAGLKPDVFYTATCVAKNENGASEPFTFEIAANA